MLFTDNQESGRRVSGAGNKGSWQRTASSPNHRGIGCSGCGSTTPLHVSGISIDSCQPLQRAPPPYTHPEYIVTYPSGCRCTYSLLLFVGSGSWLHKVPRQEASPRNLLGRMNAQNHEALPAGHGSTCLKFQNVVAKRSSVQKEVRAFPGYVRSC